MLRKDIFKQKIQVWSENFHKILQTCLVTVSVGKTLMMISGRMVTAVWGVSLLCFLILHWTYLGFSSVVVLEKFPPSMVNPWIFTSFRFPFFARPLMVESLIEIVTWYSGHTLKNYLFDPSNCCHHCSRYHHQEAWRLTSDIYLLTKNFITVSLQLIPLHEKIELLSLKSMKITPKQ